jgi:hypothetical protein
VRQPNWCRPSTSCIPYPPRAEDLAVRHGLQPLDHRHGVRPLAVVGYQMANSGADSFVGSRCSHLGTSTKFTPTAGLGALGDGVAVAVAGIEASPEEDDERQQACHELALTPTDHRSTDRTNPFHPQLSSDPDHHQCHRSRRTTIHTTQPQPNTQTPLSSANSQHLRPRYPAPHGPRPSGLRRSVDRVHPHGRCPDGGSSLPR